MDKLTASQQQQVKKMSDDRLRTKLVAFGYDEDVVWSWEREELLDRYAELILVGGKPKETAAAVDPELEKQRLELQRQSIELERLKAERDAEMVKERMSFEKEKAEQDRLERERQAEMEKQKIAIEMERINFEKLKAEAEAQRWQAEREDKRRREEAEYIQREEDKKRQDAKEKRQDEMKNDKATKAKRYGEAIRGSIIPMGADAIDAIVFFKRAEQLFVDYDIPAEFQAKVISPFLSAKAKAVLSKLTPEVTAVYSDMKAAILQELKLSARTYLERFNTCGKASDETYISFASKLRSLLDYYLESRGVKDFEQLCELLVCDRIKSTLSDNCLKYVLSVESGMEASNWLPRKQLCNSIDRFVASRADSFKPRAYALGQTPQRNFRPGGPMNNSGSGGWNKPPPTPVAQTATPPRPMLSAEQKTGNTHNSFRPVKCYECGRIGHMRSNCPNFKKSNTGSWHSSKRVTVVNSSGDSAATANDSEGQKGKPVTHETDNSQNTVSDPKYEVNRVGLVATDVVNNECDLSNDVLFSGYTEKNVDNVTPLAIDAVAMCCPVSQLSTLTYVDVKIKCDDNDDGLVVHGLVDTGAEIPVLKADLLGNANPEIMGKIKLQPFCGDAVEADWIKLMIQPNIEVSGVEPIIIDCAVVPNLNEEMIITANVMSRLSQCERNVLVASNTVGDNNDDDDDDNDNECDKLLACDCDVGVLPQPIADGSYSNDVVNVSSSNDVMNSNVADDDTVVKGEGSDSNEDGSADLTSCQQVVKEQREDESLKGCFALTKAGKGGFELLDDLLYHRKTVLGESYLQLVVPSPRRSHVLELGHDVFGGHMGVRRTKERIEYTFYWPTLQADCSEYVKTCRICQLKKRKTTSDRVPIAPIQRSDRVFDHMFIDCCGPFISGEGSKPRYNYALIAVDSYSRFPFCIPLKSMHAKNVCEALLEIWQFTGVCCHISSDMGTNFTSKLTRELEKQMGCCPRFNSPFHPNATGLAERGVGNVKSIIAKLAADYPLQWDRYLSATLWALRESVNATTGLSPWTLVFGRVPRGPLSILKNHWIGTEKLPVSFGKSATDYLRDVQKRLEVGKEYAASHAKREQERYQKYHNLRSVDKHFSIGEAVLVLIPDSTASKLFSKWTGPGTVTAVRSPYSYEIELEGTRRHYHANQLRKFHVRVESVFYDSFVYNPPDVDDEVSNVNSCGKMYSCAVVYEDDDDFGHIDPVPMSLHNPSCHTLPSEKIDLDSIKHLSETQQVELLNLLDQYPECFSDTPGFCDVITHSISLKDGFKPKRLPAYRIPERLKPEVSRQIHEMLDNGIIRPSQSPMASPLVCVLKGKEGCDGIRLAVDYRYVNKFTHSDVYPMPDLQNIFHNVAKSGVISVCDLNAGYWQLEIAEEDRWLTSFVCDDGVFEFTRVPFGLKNSGACFVRAMSEVLHPIYEIAKSFVDDVAVHSDQWKSHLVDLKRFLEIIKWAGLTLNLKKCKWALPQVKYCGKIIGSGMILPDPDKLSVLDNMSPPKTQKELRRTLGFFNYFREHIAQYAEIAKPLTDLTSKRYRSQIPWGESQEQAFSKLKELLKRAANEPLYPVDFSKPFCLFVDTSNFSTSAALTQLNDEGKYLPIAFSNTKLTEAQRKYSVIEKEAYAVLCALRKYRHWIFGSTTTVFSDHNPLTYLTESMPKSAKLVRWSLGLQEFNINFQYYPGHKNVVADCLSRLNSE